VSDILQLQPTALHTVTNYNLSIDALLQRSVFDAFNEMGDPNRRDMNRRYSNNSSVYKTTWMDCVSGGLQQSSFGNGVATAIFLSCGRSLHAWVLLGAEIMRTAAPLKSGQLGWISSGIAGGAEWTMDVDWRSGRNGIIRNDYCVFVDGGVATFRFI